MPNADLRHPLGQPIYSFFLFFFSILFYSYLSLPFFLFSGDGLRKWVDKERASDQVA